MPAPVTPSMTTWAVLPISPFFDGRIGEKETGGYAPSGHIGLTAQTGLPAKRHSSVLPNWLRAFDRLR